MVNWTSTSTCAWVVNSGRGPLGIYWWNPRGPHAIEQDGIRTALFRTRAEARKHLQQAKRSYPKAKVQRVLVTIEPLAKH